MSTSFRTISANDWLDLEDPPPLLDVRSPGEFTQGHWPGARNLPLFSDDERAEVGTLYKQTGPDAAFLRGLEFSGKKMRWYIEEARCLAPDGRIAVHCWRGGQRSQSMAWLLSKAFKDVTVLEGGYKTLRNTGRQRLADFQPPLLLLGGPTGSGKTKILHALRERGATVIDLERLARHKGSSFGALGEEAQPTVEQFENDLFVTFNSLRENAGPIWLENESQSIGRVYLPRELWQKMMAAPLIQLDIPVAWRVDNLVEDYARYPKAALIESFERIRKRLGGQHLNTALAALAEDDFVTAAEIALRYYDKAYNMSLKKNGQRATVTLKPAANEVEGIVAELMGGDIE